MRTWMMAALAAWALLAAAPAAVGQEAGKPLTIVVGYPPGGSSDRVARMVADRLKDRLRTSVIVENKTGAGGRIAAQYLRNAHEDVARSTLMLANPAVMVVAPLVYAQPGYNAARDFQPVSLVSSYHFALAVSASSPIHDVAALRKWVKDNPKQFTVGVPATGSLPHFFALMFGQQIGQQPEVVGYRGSAPLTSELIGGILPQAIDTLDTLLPQHQGGKIRILAISADQRDPALPDVPTFRESGIDLSADGWNGFFASSAMPKEQAARLGKEIEAVVREPALQQAIRAVNLEPVVADAAETARRLQAYRQQWEPPVRASGFTATQ